MLLLQLSPVVRVRITVLSYYTISFNKPSLKNK